MPISIREQLQQKIETAVSGQFRVTAEPIDDDELPICVVAYGEDASANDEQHGATVYEMPVVVGKGDFATDSDLDTLRAKCNELLASIISEMHADETFEGFSESVEPVRVATAPEPGKRCMAEAEFLVRYQTVRGDPYTLA